jgi:hypothetical protein
MSDKRNLIKQAADLAHDAQAALEEADDLFTDSDIGEEAEYIVGELKTALQAVEFARASMIELLDDDEEEDEAAPALQEAKA